MLVKMLMSDLEMEDLLLPMLLARTMYQNSEQGKILLVDKLLYAPRYATRYVAAGTTYVGSTTDDAGSRSESRT
jgi:hypothetical protein